MYIHNFGKFKNGVEMIKKEVNVYIKVPVILRYEYNKGKKKWTWRYYIQKMYQTVTREDFIKEN